MTGTPSARKLTLGDITDLRAYERERQDFRARIIALKKKRRVGVGPYVTLVFENRDTIRFQIQEMARVEKLITDEAIETELRVYNPLIPEPGHLSATLFVELTTDALLREWLPKLVGIEAAVVFRIGAGADAVEVHCVVDPDHAEQLTRDDITASVHYVHFALSEDQVDRFAAGPVTLALDHPEYRHELVLTDVTREELLADLRA
jgi:hypothetical protein